MVPQCLNHICPSKALCDFCLPVSATRVVAFVPCVDFPAQPLAVRLPRLDMTTRFAGGYILGDLAGNDTLWSL
jgi:hypothetical protein